MAEFGEAGYKDGHELYHAGIACCGDFDAVPSGGQGVQGRGH